MIYFVEQQEKYVKIGFTSGDVVSRVRYMQIGNPHKLNLIAAISGGTDVERRLHDRFSHHRVRGEWFVLHKEIIEYIDTFIDGWSHPFEETDLPTIREMLRN
jgi:hypothetical protein